MKNSSGEICLLKFIKNYCYVFIFLKTFKYDFNNYKQSKDKYVSGFNETFYWPHYFMCHCRNLYHIYNNNLLIPYFHHTTISQIFKRWSSNHEYFVRTQLYTRLTEFLLLTVVCFVLTFYAEMFVCPGLQIVFKAFYR